jgi:hypothetical protein
MLRRPYGIFQPLRRDENRFSHFFGGLEERDEEPTSVEPENVKSAENRKHLDAAKFPDTRMTERLLSLFRDIKLNLVKR